MIKVYAYAADANVVRNVCVYCNGRVFVMAPNKHTQKC